MLKTVLLDTLSEIETREARNESVMKDCVETKLDRSLRNYEDNLKQTCAYILSRNPVSIMKGMAKELGAEESKEEPIDEEDSSIWNTIW